jgi:exodeoxyribonuclease VII small subunit
MTSGPTPGDDAPIEPTTLGYADAVAELETLLRELDDDRLDVDLLAAKVARATELVVVCRARIDAARFAITSITGNAAEAETTPEPAPGSGA